MKYDVIIVGTGMAGLTAGLKLAKSGKKIALLEKHYIPGGYATNFTRKDSEGNTYTFDVSLHSLGSMNKGCTIFSVFNNLGIAEKIPFIKNTKNTKLAKLDDSIIIPHDFEEWKSSFINRYPEHEEGIKNLFSFMKEFYEDVCNLNFPHDAPKYQIELESISIDNYIRKYVDNDEFIDIFCYLWTYAGLPPKKLNAFYYMIIISSYVIGGHWYIEGGSGNMSKIMKEEIEKFNNSKVYLSSEVIKINTLNNKIISVTTKNNEVFEADEFIFACSPVEIFSRVDGEKSKEFLNYMNFLNNLEESMSITQLYIALDCKSEDIGIKNPHTFVYNVKIEDYWNKSNSNLFENTNCCITAYDQLDPNMNKTCFLGISRCDFIKNWPERGTEEYKSKKQQTTRLLLDIACKIYPDIEKHIKIMELGTPRTMQRYTNNLNGAVYGWAQNVNQGGFNRSYFKTPFNNAIVVSSWSYPGGGYEGAIYSGFIGALRLLSKKSTTTNHSNQLVSLPELMNGLVSRFNPENAQNFEATYKFLFDGHDPIYLEVKNQTAKLLPSSETPSKIDTTIITTHEIWNKISFDEISGRDALLDGLLKCEGNLKHFASIPNIFNKN